MFYYVLALVTIIIFSALSAGTEYRVAFPDDLHVGAGGVKNERGHHPQTIFNDNGEEKQFEIPLDFIQKLNTRNVSDLLLNFVEDEEDTPFIQSRFGEDEGIERNAAAIIPKAAGCLPELRTIKIANSNDPSILYIPECTRVERCGGCCSHKLLSCQPVEMETINYKVLKTQYTGDEKLKIVGKEIVQIERHTKCKCDCKIRAENCTKFQDYNKSECRCVCTNKDEEKKCYKKNDTKLWNPELCLCQCREISQCSSGYKFDHNECHCIPMRRRFESFKFLFPSYDD